MITEERIARTEKNVDALARVQDQMMDLLAITVEGERRLATRLERTEESLSSVTRHLDELAGKLSEMASKLDGLIEVVDGIVRRG